MNILGICVVIGAVFFLFGSIEILLVKGLLPGFLFIILSLLLLASSVWYLLKNEVPNKFSSLLIILLIPLEISVLVNMLIMLYDIF